MPIYSPYSQIMEVGSWILEVGDRCITTPMAAGPGFPRAPPSVYACSSSFILLCRQQKNNQRNVGHSNSPLLFHTRHPSLFPDEIGLRAPLAQTPQNDG